METSKEKEFENFEDEVFKALDNQKRRDVLRYIGERKNPTFTEIMNATNIQDSPTLSYHLRSLKPFILQEKGKYSLTSIGKAAYGLLLRTTTYNEIALLHKKKHCAIIGHIVLWASAWAAGLVSGVDTAMTTIILPVLAGTSLVIIQELFE